MEDYALFTTRCICVRRKPDVICVEIIDFSHVKLSGDLFTLFMSGLCSMHSKLAFQNCLVRPAITQRIEALFLRACPPVITFN